MQPHDASGSRPSPARTPAADGRSPASTIQYVAEVDRNGTILALSLPIGPLAMQEVLGTQLQAWLAPAARPTFELALTEAFAAGEPRVVASIGGTTGRSLESRITPVWRDGHIAHAVVTTEDVTEREQEQAALRESEQQFHALVQGGFEGLAITVDGKILVLNDALARLLGAPAEEIIGRSGYDFTAPESRAVALAHVRAGDESAYEVTGLRADGTRYPCELLGRNIVYRGLPARLTAFRDLTERHRLEHQRKEIEEQMGQAQKLESLGTLAGGIAHDFNNLLMAVLANAEAALRLPELSAVYVARVADIRATALRGRELTRQLLNYAAQGPLTVQPVDLSDLVRDTIALIGVSISKKAELVLELPDEPAVVDGDPGQLRQVIMNLAINASEALTDHAGRIEVHIAPVQLTEGELEGSPLLADIPSGRAVMLRVRDTGLGMSVETQRRIFEPFFSTKLTGRGLGLASVLNIVRGHRGAIAVRSEPGVGSELSVWLKRSDAQPAARSAPAQARSGQASRGLVLVADDEPMLRDLATAALESLGFATIAAQDGEQALQLFDEHIRRLTLVLLDLTMPKVSGVEALRRMRERPALIPVLCTSGYSSELIATELTSMPATGFLAKPYSLAELTSGIDALLGSSTAPRAR